MVAHLRAALPLEACGFLAGKGTQVTQIYAVTNRLASPSAYEMEPTEQLEAMLDIEAKGLDVLAIYHSHPMGPSTPSSHDVALAYYPEPAYVIVSFFHLAEPSIRAFRILAGMVSELVYQIK